MKTISAPRLMTFESLFFDLNWTNLPSFESLLNFDLRDIAPGEELPEDAKLSIISELNSIHKVCDWAGYQPVITEFALIADPRMLLSKKEGYFCSFISVFSPKARAVSRAYHAALTFMASGEADGEQIVPHPTLFAAQTGLLFLNLSTDANSVSPPPYFRLAQGSTPYHLTAVRQSFHQLLNPKHPLREQVGAFTNKFMDNINQNAELKEISELISQCTFVLIPFVRPGVKLPSSDSEHIKDESAQPGGALFLFLRPKSLTRRSRTVRELGRAISWLLVSASLKEAYSAFEVNQKQSSLLGSMVHGTVTAIRSIRTAEVRRAIEDNKPDDVIRALNIASMGEDAAAALLIFCEANLEFGKIPDKYRSIEDSNVVTLVQEASDMIKSFAKHRQPQECAPVCLRFNANAVSKNRKGWWTLPTGYLSPGFVRGVVAEILKNASIYGKRSQDESVVVECIICTAPAGGIELKFSNERRSTSESSRTGFLSRTQQVLENIKGLALEFEAKGNHFEVKLWLGPLPMEQEKSSTKSDCPLPYWKLKTSKKRS